MEVYRLQRGKYGEKLTGSGAAAKGARWNSAGTQLVYTSGNRALAMAEVAVHFSLATLPSDFHLLTIFIPDEVSITLADAKKLPPNWNSHPPILNTQRIGDEFVSANRYCLLKVPSAVVRGDFNILINPAHKEFGMIRVTGREAFPFDQRLFKSS